MDFMVVIIVLLFFLGLYLSFLSKTKIINLPIEIVDYIGIPYEIYGDSAANGPAAPDTVYVGKVNIPTRIYEGDSLDISIHLKAIHKYVYTSKIDQPVNIEEIKNGKQMSVVLEGIRHIDDNFFLEIELLAAGLKIDGEKKQQQPIRWPHEDLKYYWNCYFENSGTHTINLILKLIRPSNTNILGTAKHTVKVVRVDHLTKRQLMILMSLSVTISTLLAFAKILKELGVW